MKGGNKLTYFFGVSPHRLHKLPDEVSAQGTFHHRAQQKSQQGAEARAEGIFCFASAQQLADEGAQKGAENDAPGHEEQAGDRACQTAPFAPSAATAVLGAQQGDEVVEHLHDDNQHKPHHELRGAELYAVGKVQHQHAAIGQRRAGQGGENAARQTCQQAEDAQYNQQNVHIRKSFPQK